MKKILIFSTTYFPYVGGAEVAIDEITKRLTNFQFDLITAKFSRRTGRFERRNNVNIHRVGFGCFLDKFFLPTLGFLKAKRLYREQLPAIIWGMMASYGSLGAMFFKSRNPKIPFLLTLQEGDPLARLKRRIFLIKPIFLKIFQKADFIQVISNYLISWAKEFGYKGEIEVVPNGVDIEHFTRKYSEEELKELKAKLGKKPDDKYLVTASRLAKKNAIDDVIRSLPRLSENIKFLVLGTGPDFNMLKKLAKQLGVEKRVIFLGHVDHKEMPKYLKISDIFIRPSLSEGMGNSFIEAMAAGIPVIATQEGGIVDFLFDPKMNPDKKPTGRAVNRRDPKGIAAAVKFFLEDQTKTKEIIANAKELAIKNYDWGIIAEKMDKIFNKLCAS